MLAKHFLGFLYNPFSPFAVVIEKSHPTAFITEHPMSLLENGKVKKLPWLLSQTLDEGLCPAAEFYNDKHLQVINDRWEDVAKYILEFNETTSNADLKIEVSKKIRQNYLGDAPITKKNFMTFDNVRSKILEFQRILIFEFFVDCHRSIIQVRRCQSNQTSIKCRAQLLLPLLLQVPVRSC